MAHYSTILNQLAAFFPRHDIEKLASKHHRGQKFRSFNCWSQFLAMVIAQPSCGHLQRTVENRTVLQMDPQNFKVKTFLGTSENAVLTQLWIALCLYLLLAYLKLQAKMRL